MTPEELAAAVALVCGETVKFEYSVRTKKGKATSTWRMYRADKRQPKHLNNYGSHPAADSHGPTKAAAMEDMVVVAMKWADAVNASRERMRKYYQG